MRQIRHGNLAAITKSLPVNCEPRLSEIASYFISTIRCNFRGFCLNRPQPFTLSDTVSVRLSTAEDKIYTSEIVVYVQFSREVDVIESEDFVVTNMTITSLERQNSRSRYRLVGEVPDDTGTVTLSLPADVTTDDRGVGNEASNTLSLPITKPFTGFILGDKYVNGNYELLLVMNRDLTSITPSDFEVVGGGASVVSVAIGNPKSTVDLSVEVADPGDILVRLKSAVIEDQSGVTNRATGWWRTTFIDTVPAVTLQTSNGSLITASIAVELLMVVSELTSEPTIEMFDVVNGELTQIIRRDDNTYQLFVVADGDGQLSVTLPSDSIENLAGTGNLAASIQVTVDTERPSVMLTAPPRATATFTVQVRFSKSVRHFDLTAIQVVNGHISRVQGQGDYYILTLVRGSRQTNPVIIELRDGVGITESGQLSLRLQPITIPAAHLKVFGPEFGHEFN